MNKFPILKSFHGIGVTGDGPQGGQQGRGEGCQQQEEMLKCVEIYQLAQHCSVAEGDECLGRHCWGNRQSAFAAAGSPSLLYNQTNVTHVGVGPICI